MTQEQLAEVLGVSKRSIGSWERGESVPRNRVAALVDVLGFEEEPEFGPRALLLRIGALAKRRREELGLSHRSMAAEAGVAFKTIVNVEAGRHLPSPIVQHKLERVLGWRGGSFEAVLGMVNRKASSILMEELDAEDSIFIEKESGRSLAQIPDQELLAELGRRLQLRKLAQVESRDLFDLAASHNNEHLEPEDGEN